MAEKDVLLKGVQAPSQQKNSTLAKSDSNAGAVQTAWPERMLETLSFSLLPLRAVRITLQASRDVNTRFQHAHALSAWLRYLARETVSSENAGGFDYLRIDPLESGHVNYQAGDFYHFSIFCAAPGLPTLARILERLWFPTVNAANAVKEQNDLAFGPHWQVQSVQDWFNESNVSSCAELSAYDAETLMAEASIWQEIAEKQPVVWQWLSPARVLKAKDKRGKGENRFCRDAADLSAQLLLERSADALSHMARTIVQEVPARNSASVPAALAQHHDVFWVQDDYHPPEGEPKPKGGLLGRHRLNIRFSLEWASLLVLAQYLGIGQGTSSGLGRFRLETTEGQVSYRRGFPACDWLERSLQADNLLEAWRHVRESRQSIPIDAVELSAKSEEDDFSQSHDYVDIATVGAAESASLLDLLNWRIRALQEGRYEAPYARACLLPKRDGGSRMLAIPPFWDAVLQRAVSQKLSPALDSLMHPESFGYRRGRSRRSAAEAIQKARRDGFRWIYDADIEDFFGSVNHDRLHGRLLALFDDDPIIDVLMKWVRAPIRWQGVDHPRRQGLPQGSNLSPLLANLMLDDFDNDMEAAGIRLVRFADDFVLLCKSREQAEEASLAAASSLREHGFELHETKSRIANLDDGLEFLGYLFVNDYAIDISANRVLKGKASKRSGKSAKIPAEQSLQMAHWLAKISRQPPRSLSVRELETRGASKALSQLNEDDVLAVDEQFDSNGSLYLVGYGHLIYTEGGHLVVAKDDERVLQRPWQHLNHVFLMGNQHITTPALRVAARQGVNVYATTATGHLDFCVSARTTTADQRLWLRQAVTSEDMSFCTQVARELVAARIRHQFEVLRHRVDSSSGSGNKNTTEWLKQLSLANDLSEINGVEGRAAALFFEQFAKLIPDSFGFSGRARRPPPDPVNVLLSMGYQVLYANADTFLKAERLLPAIGVYHRAGRNHAALASDMMEPFRHIVEQSVLQLLRRNSIKSEDFNVQPDGGGCLILPPARRRFMADLHSRLAKPIKPRGELEPLTYRTLLHRQCHSMALAIDHQDAGKFRVFRKR